MFAPMRPRPIIPSSIQKPRAEYSLTCGCNQCRIALPVMDAESFLSNTISILATSADLRITIDNLARLATTELAESCAVFMFENEQAVRRLSIASRSESTPVDNPVDLLYPLDL